jgi:hypothetical protein
VKLNFLKMKKSMFTAFAVGLCLSANVMAQVPSYVPTNGLVGYWPFNGNANDESGNGNNGTVNGATLTADRFGNTGKAYSFDGVNDNIRVTNSTSLNSSSVSISGWFNADILPVDNTLSVKGIIGKWWQSTSVCNSNYNAYLLCLTRPTGQSNSYLGAATNFYAGDEFFDNNGINTNNWIHFVFTHNSLIGGSLFINGVLVNSNSVFGSICNSINDLIFGADVNNGDLYRFFDGNIDDIGIWNRALTDQEISDLYNANICYDYVTVTDTLIINTGITGYNPITYLNTLKIWPNPSNDHITIDAGNLATMNGYTIKIEDAQGQQVFQNAVNQQQFYVDITTWGGNGLYFVRIIDPQGNTVDIRKIVLQ